MKTWKKATISILTFAALTLTVASGYAFHMWGLQTQAPLNQYTGTNPPLTQNPAPLTQIPAPITQTNTQPPTLYTPPTYQTTTPGYTYGGGMGGCMGRWGYGPSNYPTTGTTTTLTISQAAETAKNYVASLNNPDLAVKEVEEYTGNFYVRVFEKSTGMGAFELLINKYTGVITAEMGPNMMWNTKYTFGFGYCNWARGQTTATPTVTVEQAKTYAQQYLDSYLQGTTVGDVTAFYGYYTVEVLDNSGTYGMLSVNGFTGQIWVHTWHGTFIQELAVS